MTQHHPLPIIGIHDICTAPHQEAFTVFRYEEQADDNLLLPHKHDFFMLLLITGGGGTHTIDFTTHETGAAQVHFLAPGQAHSWVFRPGTTGYQLLFDPGFLPGAAPWPFYSFSAQPVLAIQKAQQQKLVAELDALLEEYHQTDRLAPRLLQSRLLTLLTLLERYYTAAYPEYNPSPIRQTATRFLALLERHYKENATAEFYAAQLNITPQYLNSICKKETGVTAGDCIRRRLLLEAKRLLTFSDLDVKEIAYGLGFSDTSYFSRFFRRYAGMAPMEFRQEIQKVPGKQS
jgi:AraC-like DNA-binding protein